MSVFCGLLRISPVLLLFSVAAESIAAARSAPRPNLILILSDDMGYSDLGCYGGEIHTPNLDRLARGGVRFTQFYNTARCCPTRASLLTGLYPHQAGIGHMMTDRGLDGYRGDLNGNCLTIAEALKPAGYRSYAVGKWHVTRHIQPGGPKHNWPLQRGFERYYGTIHGAGSYFDPSTLTRDNTPVSPFADPEYRPKVFYYTDAIADHAVRFLRDHERAHAGEPFFLYVAFTAAHWPMHALPEDIARYHGKYAGGYAPVRAARLQRMIKLGLVPPAWEPAPLAQDWEKVSDPRWESACMEVYAAMVDRMDQGVGKIVAELKRARQFDNTLLLFLQDNGGCAENMGRNGAANHPEEPRGDHPTLPPLELDALLPPGSVPPQTRDGYPVLMGKKVMPGPGDTFIAYGKGWANVSNTPFREYKHWTHEGGISTPLIVHWPAGIDSSRRNQLERQPAHLVDLMATCLDVAGVQYPDHRNGVALRPLAGVSLVPAFAGRELNRSQPLFWEHEGNRAVRQGRWKLVSKENQLWELYDMENDRTERNDLASSEPEQVRELSRQWDAWAERCQVLPLGSWRSTNQNLSRETRFRLKAGDHLDRNQAPALAGRAFTITAWFEAGPQNGVIVAQGGSAHGYSLFLQEGRIHFALRRARRLSSVAASMRLAAGPHTAAARLAADGTLLLTVDDGAATTGKAEGLLEVMPTDGLEVGEDRGGAVGPYRAPNRFTGRIESVLVELDDASEPGAH